MFKPATGLFVKSLYRNRPAVVKSQFLVSN